MGHKLYIFELEVKAILTGDLFCAPVIDTTTVTLPRLDLALERWHHLIALHKVDVEIIRFLAENGAHTAYDMSEGLKTPRPPPKRGHPSATKENIPRRDASKALDFDYKRILRHSKGLQHKGLLKSEKIKRRFVYALTFEGLHVHLQNRGEINLRDVMMNNPDVLPLCEHWNELTQIVGNDVAEESVAGSVARWHNPERCLFRIQVDLDHIDLHSNVFLAEPKKVVPAKEVRNVSETDFGLFLSRNEDLRKSYGYYLASNDMLPEINAKLDRRNLKEISLPKSGSTRKQFFGEYGSVEYFFTGMIIDEIIKRILDKQ